MKSLWLEQWLLDVKSVVEALKISTLSIHQQFENFIKHFTEVNQDAPFTKAWRKENELHQKRWITNVLRNSNRKKTNFSAIYAKSSGERKK